MTGRALGGGGVLLRRLTAWWAADGVKAAAARLLGTLAAAGFAVGLLLAAPVLWWPLAGIWLIASWFATPADTAEEDDETEEDDEDAGVEFLAELHRLMPRPGDRLHVAQIAEQLFGSAAEAPRVRELCAAAEVPIEPVRVKGRGSSTGVKRDRLPPVVGVVAAGHSDNNNTEGVPDSPGREGFYTLPDPANPAGTQVRWITEKKAS